LTQPSDSNYWLLIDRVNGTNFNFYSKALSSDPWQLIGVSPIARSDLSGLTLQVGIAQATFDAGPGQAQFENFTLVAVPEPAAAALFCGGLALGAILSLKRRGLRQEIPGSTDQRACRGGYR
jgi:hypothetical protein